MFKRKTLSRIASVLLITSFTTNNVFASSISNNNYLSLKEQIFTENEKELVSDINKGETLRLLKLELNEIKSNRMELQDANENLKLKLREKYSKKEEEKIQEVKDKKDKVRKSENAEKQTTESKTTTKKRTNTSDIDEIIRQNLNRKKTTGSKHDNLLAPSEVSIEDIDKVLEGSLLEGNGKVYVYAEQVTGVNAAFLAAISILESGWGRSRIAQDKNNLFGYRAYNRNPYENAATFKSNAHGAVYVAMKLRENYLEPNGKFYNGTSVEEVNIKYSQTDYGTPNWS